MFSDEWQGGGCGRSSEYLAVQVQCAGDPPPRPPPGPLPPPTPPGPPLTAFGTAKARQLWIATQLANARHHGLDGLAIDIEVSSASERAILTSLVEEGSAAFRADNPHALLAFSVSPYPTNDGRTGNLLGMDYAAISQQVDVMFVMGYGTGGVPPVAFGGGRRASTIDAAAAEYARLGVAAHKIVVGILPGGVDFTCNVSSAPGAAGCTLPLDSRTGKPAGAALAHRPDSFPTHDWPGPTVAELLAGRTAGWDQATGLPFLDYRDADGKWHQLWFEDTRSICIKQQLVERRQLGGMGLFLADFLSGESNRTATMWGALARAVGDKSVCTSAKTRAAYDEIGRTIIRKQKPLPLRSPQAVASSTAVGRVNFEAPVFIGSVGDGDNRAHAGNFQQVDGLLFGDGGGNMARLGVTHDPIFIAVTQDGRGMTRTPRYFRWTDGRPSISQVGR